MMQYGATFGFVGLAFTGVDCFAETVRGKTTPDISCQIERLGEAFRLTTCLVTNCELIQIPVVDLRS